MPRDLGEFGLIDRLTALLPRAEALEVGPGDDCAVWRDAGGALHLATTDMLVDGLHFDLGFSSPRDVGYKAVAVNVSDIAACGGVPAFGLVALGVPASVGLAALDDLYRGIAEAAESFGIAIVGGDTVGTERLTVSIAAVGDVERPVLRSGARPGDAVCVTGELGGAAAGLWLLREAADGDRGARDLLDSHPGLAEAHRRGRARVREGLAAAARGARAMIDVSDGLGQDVGHICAASGVRAEIAGAALPLADGVTNAATWRGVPPASVALAGGDDYELVVVLDPARVEDLRSAIAPVRLTQIGTITEGSGVNVDGDVAVDDAGWDHFA